MGNGDHVTLLQQTTSTYAVALLGAYFYIGLSIFPALAIAASSNFSSMGAAKRSLVFFDGGQDNLDTLSKKYPHLAEVAFKP